MRHFARVAFLCAAVVGSGHAARADPPATAPRPAIEPGEYVYEGGGGTLAVEVANGKLTFAIETVGANAHTCGLAGTVTGLEGRTGADGGLPACVFRLTPRSGAVTIGVETDEACRAFCGVRAVFEGEYRRPAPPCRARAIGTTRAAFKRLYDGKSFEKARATLEPLLRCEDVVDRFTRAWIRNDLAVTRHALHDDAGCRDVLEPLRDLAADDDPGAGEPAFKDELTRIAIATRYNLQVCGASEEADPE